MRNKKKKEFEINPYYIDYQVDLNRLYTNEVKNDFSNNSGDVKKFVNEFLSDDFYFN